MVSKRRRFGTVRRLPSGQWQARYRGPDGLMRSAPHTFPRKRDADQWLSVVESEIISGDWLDPDLGCVKFGEFGQHWIKERRVAKRVREENERIFRMYVAPMLGQFQVNEVGPDAIRKWRAWLLDNGRSEDRTAKAYRLVRAMFNTAVDDGRIKRNPCRIKGADQHRTPERSYASIDEVYRLADLMPSRFRFLVLLAAFSGLRWGELVALERRDVDRQAMTVRVARSLAEGSGGGMEIGPPKSPASVRTVALPGFLADELVHHLAEHAQHGNDGLLFVGDRGGLLRRGNFRRATKWQELVRKAGLPVGFHFHDLRHTGNQLAAESGATTQELMQRMGQSTVRAALIYQHATNVRDRQIAGELSARVQRHRQVNSDSAGRRPDDY